MSGTFSGTSTELIQPSGQIKVAAHQLLTAGGEGSSGNHYTISDTVNSSFLFAPDNFPTTITQIINSRVIGQGDAPDFLLHITNHLTINANGVETVRIFDFSSECR